MLPSTSINDKLAPLWYNIKMSEGLIDNEAYLTRLDEINDSWRIVKDPRTGMRFEIAIANQDFADKQALVFPSTEWSSLTQNIVNAEELAAQAAEKPHTARVYVAFFGNGGTQSLPLADRWHFMKTGRFTRTIRSNYQPLPAVQAMARAIEQVTVPTHVSADVAGGRLALGLMAAFDTDTIKDAFLNGIPGISHKANYVASSLSEDLSDRFKGRVGDKTEAREHMPRIYHTPAHLPLLVWTYLRAAANVPTNLAGLSGHDNLADLPNHAVFQDTLAALARQEALITMQFNRKSNIHNVEDCLKFGELVMSNMPVMLHSDKRGLKIEIGEGTRDAHTTEPADRMEAERKALSSIARFMLRLVPGGKYRTEAAAQLERAA